MHLPQLFPRKSDLRRWLVPLCALLIGGVLGRWLSGPGSENPTTQSPVVVSRAVSVGASNQLKVLPEYSSVKIALDDRSEEYFGRLADWVLHTEESEVSRIWELCKGDHKGDLKLYRALASLSLVRWAELNPLAMIEATSGSVAGYAAWARVDVEAAVAAVLEGESILREGGENLVDEKVKRAFLRALAEIDPVRALELMEQHPNLKPSSDYVISQIKIRIDPREGFLSTANSRSSPRPGLKEWASAEPEAALRWVLNEYAAADLVSPKSSLNFRAMIDGISPKTPDELERLAAILPEGPLRISFMKKQVGKLIQRDPEAAISLARSQEGAPLREALMSVVGAKLAFEDPERSLALLEEYLEVTSSQIASPDGSLSGQAATPGYPWLENLAAMAPAEAMNIVSGLPGAATNRGPAVRIANEWMQRDESGYSTWLENLRNGAERDSLVRLFVSYLGIPQYKGTGYAPDFLQAIKWVNRIDNSQKRNASLKNLISHWQEWEPVGAKTYFGTEQASGEARAVYELQKKEEGK